MRNTILTPLLKELDEKYFINLWSRDAHQASANDCNLHRQRKEADPRGPQADTARHRLQRSTSQQVARHAVSEILFLQVGQVGQRAWKEREGKRPGVQATTPWPWEVKLFFLHVTGGAEFNVEWNYVIASKMCRASKILNEPLCDGIMIPHSSFRIKIANDDRLILHS